jgi:hypothetical protein
VLSEDANGQVRRQLRIFDCGLRIWDEDNPATRLRKSLGEDGGAKYQVMFTGL